MKVLMPYVVYQAKRLEEEEKKRVLEEWGRYCGTWIKGVFCIEWKPLA